MSARVNGKGGGRELTARAAYAATRPDEAGEAARFVGGAVANTTSAYAELAAVSAELAVLEQQQKAQAAADAAVNEVNVRVDRTVRKIKNAPTKAADAIQAAPKTVSDKVTNTIQTTLTNVQNKAQSQLDAARSEINRRK